jgi:hypothetical protein
LGHKFSLLSGDVKYAQVNADNEDTDLLLLSQYRFCQRVNPVFATWVYPLADHLAFWLIKCTVVIFHRASAIDAEINAALL